MSQPNIYPTNASESTQIQNKIILLFLIDKMDIPLSSGQITQFAVEEDFMNYFSVQQYLSEMVDAGYLDKTKDNNSTRYTVTEEGSETLEFFVKNINPHIKNRILKYVSENRSIVKQDYEITANHFFEHKTNEYTVKCAVYDDEMMILELNLSVVSKEQALSICNNWRTNINEIYGQVINILLTKNPTENDKSQEKIEDEN